MSQMIPHTRPVFGDDGGAGNRVGRDDRVVATKTETRPARWVVALRAAPTSKILVALVAIACVFGTTMVGAASEVVSIQTYGSAWAILIRQCLWVVLGSVAMMVLSRFDYRKLRRFSRLLIVGAFAGLLLVLVPHLAVQATGSSRWLGFGAFDVQPSEFMKLALVIFLADLVVRREEAGTSERTVIGPLLLVTGGAAVLVIAEPDMGTTAVIVSIGLAVLVASGVSLRPVLKVAAAVVVLGVIAGLVDPYRRQRILSFLDPGAHASSSGYQVVQSLIGLGSGHILGVGLGSGIVQWGFLPNPHSDFIFSVIGEEFGLVGSVFVLVLLGSICWFGLRAASRAPDRFGALLAVGISAWIAVETFVNIGAVIGLLPVTGIPLPFVSYGGSSLVLTMAGAGILVNVARQERTDERRRLRVGRRRVTTA